MQRKNGRIRGDITRFQSAEGACPKTGLLGSVSEAGGPPRLAAGSSAVCNGRVRHSLGAICGQTRDKLLGRPVDGCPFQEVDTRMEKWKDGLSPGATRATAEQRQKQEAGYQGLRPGALSISTMLQKNGLEQNYLALFRVAPVRASLAQNSPRGGFPRSGVRGGSQVARVVADSRVGAADGTVPRIARNETKQPLRFKRRSDYGRVTTKLKVIEPFPDCHQRTFHFF